MKKHIDSGNCILDPEFMAKMKGRSESAQFTGFKSSLYNLCKK